MLNAAALLHYNNALCFGLFFILNTLNPINTYAALIAGAGEGRKGPFS